MKAQNVRPSANIVVPQVDIRTCAVLHSGLKLQQILVCSPSFCINAACDSVVSVVQS